MRRAKVPQAIVPALGAEVLWPHSALHETSPQPAGWSFSTWLIRSRRTRLSQCRSARIDLGCARCRCSIGFRHRRVMARPLARTQRSAGCRYRPLRKRVGRLCSRRDRHEESRHSFDAADQRWPSIPWRRSHQPRVRIEVAKRITSAPLVGAGSFCGRVLRFDGCSHPEGSTAGRPARGMIDQSSGGTAKSKSPVNAAFDVRERIVSHVRLAGKGRAAQWVVMHCSEICSGPMTRICQVDHERVF